MMILSSPLPNGAPVPNGARPDPLRHAAVSLETAFVSEMLKAAKMFEPASQNSGGAGEEAFTSFLADAHAEALVERGGFGLADAIEHSLRARAEGGQ